MFLVAVSLPAATLRLLRVSREKFEISELDLQLCPQVDPYFHQTFPPIFFSAQEQLQSKWDAGKRPAGGDAPQESDLISRLDQAVGVMKGFIREILPLKMALINSGE